MPGVAYLENGSEQLRRFVWPLMTASTAATFGMVHPNNSWRPCTRSMSEPRGSSVTLPGYAKLQTLEHRHTQTVRTGTNTCWPYKYLFRAVSHPQQATQQSIAHPLRQPFSISAGFVLVSEEFLGTPAHTGNEGTRPWLYSQIKKNTHMSPMGAVVTAHTLMMQIEPKYSAKSLFVTSLVQNKLDDKRLITNYS